MDEWTTAIVDTARTVVGAMATDTWGMFRDRLARWLARGDKSRQESEAVRLDREKQELDQRTASAETVEHYVRRLVEDALGRDRGRLAELVALLAELRGAAGGGQATGVHVNTGGGSVHNSPTFSTTAPVTITYAPPPEDHATKGMAALRAGDITAALRHLRARLGESDAPAETHYLLALALAGDHPLPRHRHSVDDIQQHLQRADDTPQARALRLLVDEDHRTLWARGVGLDEGELAHLAEQVVPAAARLIIDIVRVPECRMWQALNRSASRKL